MLGARYQYCCSQDAASKNIDAYKVKTYLDMREGIRDVDVIMMLRLQNERMLVMYSFS